MKTILIIRNVIIFCLITCFSCSKDSVSDDISFTPDLYTYVPDDKFEELLIDLGYDNEMDDYVLSINIKNIKELSAYFCRASGGGAYCHGYGIKDLTGIENFESLESLKVRSNQLSHLDISHNTNLKFLDCADNYLTSLDLSKNVNLEYLSIGDFIFGIGNNINSMDLSNNTNLVNFDCSNNKLSSLDISNNVNLEYLFCINNKLSSLNISNNVDLKTLFCKGNTSLECVEVNQNQLLNIVAYHYYSDPDVIYSIDCNN